MISEVSKLTEGSGIGLTAHPTKKGTRVALGGDDELSASDEDDDDDVEVNSDDESKLNSVPGSNRRNRLVTLPRTNLAAAPYSRWYSLIHKALVASN